MKFELFCGIMGFNSVPMRLTRIKKFGTHQLKFAIHTSISMKKIKKIFAKFQVNKKDIETVLQTI